MNAKVLPLRPPDKVSMSVEGLIVACGEGDVAALGILYDRLQADVWRFLARVVGAQHPELDDLVQSTFIEVYKSASRFSGRSTPKVWVFGIANNLARRHGRDRARRKKAFETLQTLPEPTSRAIDQTTDERRQIARLAQAMDRLTHDQRVAFVMCDLEEVSGVDAARALGVRPGTLWRRLHDARKALRRALEEGA